MLMMRTFTGYLLPLLAATLFACSVAPVEDNPDGRQPAERQQQEEQARDLHGGLAELSTWDKRDSEAIERRRNLEAEIIQRFSRASRVPFRITGTVVDEEGHPMDDVTVNYSVSWSAGWDDIRSESGTAQVGSAFVLEPESRGTHVTLHFKKKGYYPERRSFPAREMTGLEEHGVLAGLIPRRGLQEVEDVTIVMQKMGDVTQLQRRNVTLSFSSDGSGQIFDFGRALDHARIGKEVGVEDVTDAEQLSEKAVYVIGDMGKDGVIPYEEVPFEDMFSSVRGRCQVPKNLRMVVTDPEGGIQLFQPEGELRGSNRVARHMTRAPEKGYEQVLDLPKGIASRGYRFYFKVGEHYGRGRLRFPKISRDGQTFEIGVEFQIQPDGSRNLETMTWRH